MRENNIKADAQIKEEWAGIQLGGGPPKKSRLEREREIFREHNQNEANKTENIAETCRGADKPFGGLGKRGRMQDYQSYWNSLSDLKPIRKKSRLQLEKENAQAARLVELKSTARQQLEIV